MDKDNIEDIYPLTPMQQALLFHHLQHEKSDTGFLQMGFMLNGKLTISELKRAWQFVFERHPALRTAVFWENVDKPLQVVSKRVDLPWDCQDWREIPSREQKEKLEAFYIEDRENGFDLSKAPIVRLILIRLSENIFQFIWSCHHILLDGWSGASVLKEVFDLYNSFIRNQKLNLGRPPPYRDYVIWLQKQDSSKAQNFWRSMFTEFSPPTSSGSESSSQNVQTKNEFRNHEISFNEISTQKIQSFTQNNRITLNTLVQASWALVLGRYINTKELVVGMTVSGRPGDLPYVDTMVGLFANTLPFRVKVSAERSIMSWLNHLQHQQVEMIQFGYCSLGQIQGWSGLPGNVRLFENIVVFENYPWTHFLENGDHNLKVSNFRGGVTTVYPLTLIVKPGPQLSIQLMYNPARFRSQTIEKLLDGVQISLNCMTSNPDQSLSGLLSALTDEAQIALFDLGEGQDTSPHVSMLEEPLASKDGALRSPDPEGPQDGLEMELTKIWKQVLGIKDIGVNVNFFDLGGNSVLIATLLAQMEKKLDRKIPLPMLFQQPSIRQLAEALSQKESPNRTSLVVPIQPRGSNPPFFFYGVTPSHSLGNYLSDDQPFYGLIPQDLKGKSTSKTIIQEMASNYVSEILDLFPKGLCALGGHCWAGMLAYEIGQQLHKKGKTAPLLLVVGTTFKMSTRSYLSYLLRRRIFSHAHNLIQLDSRKKWDYIRDDLARGVKDKFLTFSRRIRKLKNKMSDTYQSAELARFDATGEYNPVPYPGQVVVFYGEENPMIHNDDPRYLTWRGLVKGDLEFRNVSGKYGGILEEPYVSSLAKHMESCLETHS